MSNIYGNTAPLNRDLADSGTVVPYTLGTRFKALVAGVSLGPRWYIPLTPQPVGGATGEGLIFSLWNAAGAELTRIAVSSIGKEGTWAEWSWTTPVRLTVGAEYTTSVYTPQRYVSEGAYTFPRTGADGALVTTSPGGYFDGAWTPTWPTNSYNNSSYFVDTNFLPDSQATGPTLKVWNGTAEVAATVKVWNGTAEVAASLSSIV